MLNFIYYPISAVLWFWHRLFDFALSGDTSSARSGIAWALSVVFLVFTLRLVLYKPFVKQVRTTRQMQELQPQIKELQKKYKNDRQTMALEMQKLQREHGFNPVMGCLPALAQAPVFIGLFHVLNSFNRTSAHKGFMGFGGGGGMSVAQNANTPNYVFSAGDVQSFLGARLFGAPISARITSTQQELQAFAAHGTLPHMWNMVVVAVPLMIIASLATHFNARASIARQSEAAAANPQAAMMNKLALWVFPIGVLVGGPFLAIAILLYWVANNIWTYGQQHLVFRRIDHEDEEKRQATLDRAAANAPKPGAKPVRRPATDSVSDSAGDAVDTGVSTNGSTPVVEDAKPKQTSGKPRPGQKRPGNRGRANQKKRR